MVYEKKCVNCGRIIDFGGEETDRLPENALEFDGKIYCRDCVKKFVQFGTGDLSKKIARIENAIKKIEDEFDMERHLED